ncbi:MAG TPA: divalent metal cation transporter [Steroidobacteraceae bacterium]|nr:divalent metal cation transporter [Steroidobacteraceae bacterium]
MVGPTDLHRPTYSQAGAQFGYAMTWTMLFTWPLVAAIQEISTRIGRVTGKGIAGNTGPVSLLRLIVSLLLVANIINLGADLGACSRFRCSPVRRLMPLRSRLAGQAALVASPV